MLMTRKTTKDNAAKAPAKTEAAKTEAKASAGKTAGTKAKTAAAGKAKAARVSGASVAKPVNVRLVKAELVETVPITLTHLNPVDWRSTTMSEQVEKATKAMATAYEEMNKYARETVDLSIKTANALTKGWEETARNAQALMQDGLSRALAAGKTIAAAKNIRDVVDTHSEFVKDYVDSVISNTGKITEISARVTKEVVEPIAQHATDAVSRIMNKSRAA